MTAAVLPIVALRAYMRAVADRLGVGIESGTVDLDPPVSFYLAIEGRAPSHPDRDLALLWSEQHGWAVAVEAHAGEELMVLGYLGGLSPIAEPAEVEKFVAAVQAGWRPASRPPEFGPTTDLDQYLPRET